MVQDAEKTPRQVLSVPLGLVGIVLAQRDLLKSEEEVLFPGPNRWGTPGGGGAERLIGYQQRVHYPYARSSPRPPFLNFRLWVES